MGRAGHEVAIVAGPTEATGGGGRMRDMEGHGRAAWQRVHVGAMQHGVLQRQGAAARFQQPGADAQCDGQRGYERGAARSPPSPPLPLLVFA